MAIISNETMQKKLEAPLEVADNPISRGLGLMFRNKPSQMIMFFGNEDYHSVHSFFVNFELDVIFLNKENIVCGLYKGIKPGTTNRAPKSPAISILELEVGSIDKLEAKLGDKITVSKKLE